jgi:tRNA-dihydrouridine synthase
MMLPHEQFRALLKAGPPLLALAPMQDVTDGPFWSLIHRYGGADVYWTEYFRVHVDSTPEKWIVDSIVQNTTGRPVVAQLIATTSRRWCARRRPSAAAGGAMT